VSRRGKKTKKELKKNFVFSKTGMRAKKQKGGVGTNKNLRLGPARSGMKKGGKNTMGGHEIECCTKDAGLHTGEETIGKGQNTRAPQK